MSLWANRVHGYFNSEFAKPGLKFKVRPPENSWRRGKGPRAFSDNQTFLQGPGLELKAFSVYASMFCTNTTIFRCMTYLVKIQTAARIDVLKSRLCRLSASSFLNYSKDY